jgi:curved DNA-binding protein CbpA
VSYRTPHPLVCSVSLGLAMDYFELLGVTRVVSDAELKSAYRRAALETHPDRCV